MHKLKATLGGAPRKKVLLKSENVKEDEWWIDDAKSTQKLQQIRLLGLLLLPIQVGGMHILLNPW